MDPSDRGGVLHHDEPRGYSSGGILRRRRRRCEMVWPRVCNCLWSASIQDHGMSSCRQGQRIAVRTGLLFVLENHGLIRQDVTPQMDVRIRARRWTYGHRAHHGAGGLEHAQASRGIHLDECGEWGSVLERSGVKSRSLGSTSICMEGEVSFGRSAATSSQFQGSE